MISLSAPDGPVGKRRPVRMEMRCDGGGGLFPCQAVLVIDPLEGVASDEASRRDWRTVGGNEAHYCPECKKKP